MRRIRASERLPDGERERLEFCGKLFDRDNRRHKAHDGRASSYRGYTGKIHVDSISAVSLRLLECYTKDGVCASFSVLTFN